MPSKKFGQNVFGSKQMRKRVAKKCKICGEDRYELLDVHRLVHGKKYSVNNTCIVCNRCHRLHHTGKIVIDKWYKSTAGRLLHWFDEEGKEWFS